MSFHLLHRLISPSRIVSSFLFSCHLSSGLFVMFFFSPLHLMFHRVPPRLVSSQTSHLLGFFSSIVSSFSFRIPFLSHRRVSSLLSSQLFSPCIIPSTSSSYLFSLQWEASDIHSWPSLSLKRHPVGTRRG